MTDFELRRDLRKLPRERAPANDLWPGIAARTAAAPAQTAPQAPRRHGRAWLAVAASLLLATLLVPWLLQQVSAPVPLAGDPGPATPVPAQTTAPMRTSVPAQTPVPPAGPRAAALHAAARHAAALHADVLTLEYSAALEQLAHQPPPPALAPVLGELDSSARQIRAALRQDPQATYLLGQLRRTYDQRLRLTRLAVAAAHTG